IHPSLTSTSLILLPLARPHLPHSTFSIPLSLFSPETRAEIAKEAERVSKRNKSYLFMKENITIHVVLGTLKPASRVTASRLFRQQHPQGRQEDRYEWGLLT